jgi:putative addiction module component (TIGR02574 family)
LEITMAKLIEELSSQARKLPAVDRVRLAEELLASVYETDDEVEAAWDEEIRLRIADIDAGQAKLIPAEEVLAQVRRLLN